MKKIKVILLFPQQDHETGVFIKNAFNSIGGSRGRTTLQQTYDDINCEVVQTLDPKVLKPEQLTENLLQGIETHKPDLIFMSSTASLADSARAVREAYPAISRPKLAMWNVDSERELSRWKSLFPLVDQCDVFFTKSHGSVELWRGEGFQHTYSLQQGIDRKVHNIPKLKQATHRHEVLFLGALDWWHEDSCARITLINRLDKEFKISYSNTVKLEAASKLYYSSLINIGSNHFPEVEGSVSVRDFKILGSGGFLLTNRVKGMENYFQEGVHCAYYDSVDDCVEKIRYYLDHNDEREEIAANGYKEVHDKHGYDDRMMEVLKTCGLLKK